MALAATHSQSGRWTRRDEILAYICQYAKENNGVTPSVRSIAVVFELHLKTVQVHIQKLLDENRIQFVGDDHRIRVERSTWEQPPEVEL